MPVVPRRPEEQIKTAPLPGVRVNTRAPEAFFGGGRAADKAFGAIQNVLQTGEEIAREEKRKADEVVVQEFDLSASIAQTDIETQMREMKGKNALAAPDFVASEWEKQTEELSKSLYNDTQRGAAARIMKARKEILYRTAQNHTHAEIERYNDNEPKAYIETVRNEAINNAMDDERVGLSLFQQQAAIEKYGFRKGLAGSEALKGDIANSASDTHVSVIEKRLSLGNVAAARTYYEAHKNEILGDDSTKFPAYIDAYEKRLRAQIQDEKKTLYDETLRKNMISAFSGKLTLSELQRQYRADETDVGDYSKMAHIVADPDFAFLRPDRLTDSATFNEIREAQLSGSKSQGEILRMIRDAAADGKVVNNFTGGKDVDYLVNLTKDIPPSSEDARADAQAKNVRDFATRYFTDNENFFQRKFETKEAKKEKDQKVETMVSEFLRRVDKEKAKGERIDEIAKEVQFENIKREHPEINRLEDVPHVIITTKGKIRRVLNPEQKSKLKASYKITPNKIEAPAEKKTGKKKYP